MNQYLAHRADEALAAFKLGDRKQVLVLMRDLGIELNGCLNLEYAFEITEVLEHLRKEVLACQPGLQPQPLPEAGEPSPSSCFL
jgi:hypothetical protein